jgi:hypothetical protein
MKVGPSTDLKKLSDEKYYFGFRIIPPIWRQSKIIMGIKTFFCHVAFSNSRIQSLSRTERKQLLQTAEYKALRNERKQIL